MVLLKRTAIAAMLISVSVLGFTACSDEGTGPFPDEFSGLRNQATFDILDYAIGADELVAPQFSEVIPTDGSVPEFVRENAAGAPREANAARPENAGNPPNPFMPLLRALQLNADQRDAVGPMLAAFHDCAHAAMKKGRETHQALIESLMEKRKEIRAALEAGEITREEAIKAIRELNARARNASNDIRGKVREAIIECEKAFYASLADILDDKQLEVLKRWLNSRGGGDKGPAGGGRDNPGGGNGGGEGPKRG